MTVAFKYSSNITGYCGWNHIKTDEDESGNLLWIISQWGTILCITFNLNVGQLCVRGRIMIRGLKVWTRDARWGNLSEEGQQGAKHLEKNNVFHSDSCGPSFQIL